MIIEELYNKIVERLTKADVDTPDVDARFILAHFLSKRPQEIALIRKEEISDKLISKIEEAVAKREKHMPVAYIVGYRYFYRDKILVSPSCLIPRPDSEHLISAAEYWAQGRSFEHALDIGTGSGALAISLCRSFAKMSIDALDINTHDAQRNVSTLHLYQINVIEQDFFQFKPTKKYDLIISNPPYLSIDDMERLAPDVRDYEPQRALLSGEDGLDFYREIARRCDDLLSPKGVLILEVDYKWKAIQEIVESEGLRTLEIIKDYGGLERCLVAEKKK